MPSFKEITGIITTFIISRSLPVTGNGSGRGSFDMRYHALQEANQGWGCPSIFSKNGCSR